MHKPKVQKQKKQEEQPLYLLSKRERLVWFLSGAGVLGILGYTFYDCWYTAALIPLFWHFEKKAVTQWNYQKRQDRIAGQFREALLGMQAAVMAGYSVENSIREAWRELCTLYGEEVWIVQAFQSMVYKLQTGQAVGNVMKEFAEKTEIEEILQFAQIFETARKTGGNLPELMRITGENIGERLAAMQEMDVIMNSRRYEQRIMDCIPIAIVIYVRTVSDGMMDMLYHNLTGYLIMTVTLGIYLTAVWLGERVTKIEV